MAADGTKQRLLRRIEAVAAALIEDAAAGRAMTLRVPARHTWQNAVCDVSRGYMYMRSDSVVMTTLTSGAPDRLRRLAVCVRVLAHVYHLIRTGTHATRRDIYYTDTHFFKEQASVDDAVSDIACYLCVPRTVLNVGATCRGIVAGPLRFVEEDREVDVWQYGTAGRAITSEAGQCHSFRSDCSCVIVVEKEASFARLCDDGVPQKLGAIVITGKGYPCISTRLFLRRLWQSLGDAVPFYVLADADPHGMHIVATYVLGSRGLLHENPHLAVPGLRWIGLTMADVDRFGVPSSALVDWGPADHAKARTLLAHPGIQQLRPEWCRVVHDAIRRRQKAELQALAAISLDFVSEVYIPAKIADAD